MTPFASYFPQQTSQLVHRGSQVTTWKSLDKQQVIATPSQFLTVMKITYVQGFKYGEGFSTQAHNRTQECESQAVISGNLVSLMLFLISFTQKYKMTLSGSKEVAWVPDVDPWFLRSNSGFISEIIGVWLSSAVVKFTSARTVLLGAWSVLANLVCSLHGVQMNHEPAGYPHLLCSGRISVF